MNSRARRPKPVRVATMERPDCDTVFVLQVTEEELEGITKCELSEQLIARATAFLTQYRKQIGIEADLVSPEG